MVKFQLEVLKFKLQEILKLYEEKNSDKVIELFKDNINELCEFILNPNNQIIFAEKEYIEKVKLEIELIRDLAIKILGIIEKEEAKKILQEENTVFKYGDDLKIAVKQEILDYGIDLTSNVLFIGSGAMPITAFTMSKEKIKKITCLDIDDEAINLSTAVANKLGFNSIEFTTEYDKIDIDLYSHVIIASLVPEKSDILKEFYKKANKDTKFILRYGNGIKELFNYPLLYKNIKNISKTVIKNNSYIYDSVLIEKEFWW